MRARRVLQGALLAVVLVGGVVLGLLGMHALDAHGAAGTHALAGHASAVGVDATSVTANAHHVSAADAVSAAPADPAGEGGAACVLALLGGLLLLLHRPGSVILGPASRALVSHAAVAAAPRRPPSLLVLCISRT